MINIKTPKIDDEYKVSQLFSLLLAKDQEIEALKKENNIQKFNLHHTKPHLDNTKSETIEQIKSLVYGLELNYINLRSDWDSFSKELQKKIDRIAEGQKSQQQQYEEINQARLSVIHEQAKALRAYRLRHIQYRLKQFFMPRIGALYQYKPKIFSLPKHYKKSIALIHSPKISIVTPSFNQGPFLERTILSITRQNYPNLEYVVQDGASKDESIEIINRHKASFKYYESMPDTGQSNALNLGFAHTTGEIMAYLNSDDILLPGTLAYIANYFNQHPEVDAVYGHRVLINEFDQEIGRWVLPPHEDNVLAWADYIPQETLFWRREIWEKVGGKIDESFKFAMDWDLLLRFKDANAKFARLPRFLGAFRVHTHQKTSAQMSNIGAKEMERLRVRCHGRSVSHAEIKRNIFSYLAKHVLFHKLYRAGILRY